MFQSINLTGEIRKRLKNAPETLFFTSGVNLLIGPNGSGKSQLMQYLRKFSKLPEEERAEIDVDLGELNALYLNYFDFEKDNFRTKSQDQAMLDGTYGMAHLFGKMNAMHLSHGESNRFYWGGMQPSEKRPAADTICMFDEPEQALDVDGLAEFEAKMLSHPWRQVLLATHSPFLIFSGKYNVVSLVPGYLASLRDHYERLFNPLK